MHPGAACLTCHATTPRAPSLTFAGTVYTTGHEPSDCNGFANAEVVITDAIGRTSRLRTNGAGNFLANLPTTQLPYRAKVVVNGKERPMIGAQMNGDCNACHSENGSRGAPGRIVVP
jgi:hypothetical protein